MTDGAVRSAHLARGGWACALVLLAWASPVSADRSVCSLDRSGGRVCGSPISCNSRAECISDVGTEDETCQSSGTSSGPSRECLHDCTTLFDCSTAGDCPRVNGLTPTCSPSANGSTTLPSICTWTSPDASTPLAEQISYCVAMGNHISPAQIALCHRLAGGAPGEFTVDYYRGDCDGDGCPNGFDTNPCMAPGTGGSCTPAGATPFESPFCAPLPAVACDVSDQGLVCGDARPCTSATGGLPCPIGSCEDGWSDVPRCRPPCSTLFLCALGTSTPEQCPPLDGASGVCLPLPSGVMPVDGRDGVCAYPDFFDTSCVTSTFTLACVHTPDGALTSNFWAGDCDMDGAPNGCDDMRCMSGGGTSDCHPAVPSECTPTYTPPPDAGVDAASDVDAASVPDAGSTTTPDSGTTSMSDGAAALDAGGTGTTFAGGGGCRCAAAGVSTRSASGIALVLAALGLVIARRKR